jgi:hypothetical protein
MNVARIEAEAERDLARVEMAKKYILPAATLRRVPLFTDEPAKPHEYIIAPLIPLAVVTLLGGHGGAGKSMLALILAAHVAAGSDWAGFKVAQGRVAYLSFEDDAETCRWRLAKITEAYGLPAEPIERNLILFDLLAGDPALATETTGRRLERTLLFDQVRDAVADCGLVIVDNASDTFDGDENNRRHVRAFVRQLGELATANNAGVLLLAHIDKSAARFGARGNSYSGSTAWHNSARSRLSLTIEENGAILLRQEKHQFGKGAAPIRLTRNADGVLILADASVLELADKLAYTAQAEHDKLRVLELLALAIESGIDVPTRLTGNASSWHALQALPDMDRCYRSRVGRDRVHGALMQLRRDSKIKPAHYRTTGGNRPSEKWELAT